jgi:hypothetical protein
MQQNKATHCQSRNECTKPKHQNQTATPLCLTKAQVCPENNKPAKQQMHNKNQKKTPKNNMPNKKSPTKSTHAIKRKPQSNEQMRNK